MEHLYQIISQFYHPWQCYRADMIYFKNIWPLSVTFRFGVSIRALDITRRLYMGNIIYYTNMWPLASKCNLNHDKVTAWTWKYTNIWPLTCVWPWLWGRDLAFGSYFKIPQAWQGYSLDTKVQQTDIRMNVQNIMCVVTFFIISIHLVWILYSQVC